MQCTINSVMCALSSVQLTVYNKQCTLVLFNTVKVISEMELQVVHI